MMFGRNMILNRIGNKKAIAEKIIQYFPKHEIYVEPFFGAGGMFFSKPKAKYNFVNDNDKEVFNLFMVAKDKPEELLKAFKSMPKDQNLFNYWKKNEETDDVWQAARFLLLSNYSLYGCNSAFAGRLNSKCQYSGIVDTSFFLDGTLIYNLDYRRFFASVLFAFSAQDGRPRGRIFIYADPPYVGTVDNYQSGFTENDFITLLDALTDMRCKFMVSEFLTPLVEREAEKRGLFLTVIGERQSIKNRNTEIILTNYKNNFELF